ncbi:ATP-binding protein [Salana multivorans]|uniref:ATP-binding protein n=1 Tax=Salana multivorans TaxID=120377 RepID=UPI001FE5A87A|nr:ATP-binding protein [Salana multivorans]
MTESAPEPRAAQASAGATPARPHGDRSTAEPGASSPAASATPPTHATAATPTTPVPDPTAPVPGTDPTSPTPSPQRPPLVRPRRGRWVGGVAAGLARHLGIDVWLVRLGFVALTPLLGIGVVGYAFWWLTLPEEGDRSPGSDRPTVMARLARPLRQSQGRTLRVGDIVVALGLLAVAAVLVASRLGAPPVQGWIIPALLLVAGAALVWGELDARRGQQTTGRVRVLRLVGGVAIAATAIVLLVGQRAEPVVVVQSALAAVAVLAGVALVLAPWWLRLVRELGDARAEREREAERADIAAHLHDSVLQTLALIKTRSTEPEVIRLARAQERDLRAWLYDDRAPAATSVAQQVREMVALVEDTRTHADGSAPEVETVVVGDVVPDEGTHALLQATREALLNAVAHGASPIAVYVEASDDGVEVSVRDHGDGFDLDHVPLDRFGVRESIIGRVRRRGGDASVVAMADGGTEVRLYLPRRQADPESPKHQGQGAGQGGAGHGSGQSSSSQRSQEAAAS